MAKRDGLLARIDADVARLNDIRSYVMQSGNDQSTVSKVEADLNELARIRDYVTNEDAPAEKPRKARKRKGLPTETT